MLMMYRHGLRVSETIALRRDNVNLQGARLWVRRLKNGLSVEHPIAGDELRAIKRYLATRTDQLPWLFLSERGQPLTRSSVQYLVRVAPTCAPCRTTSGIVTPGTPCTTLVWPAAASKGYGNSSGQHLGGSQALGNRTGSNSRPG